MLSHSAIEEPVDEAGVTPSVGGVSGWIASSFSVAGVLWFALWFGIYSGPYVLERSPVSTLDQLHYLRTLGPLVGLGLAALLLLGRALPTEHGLRRMPAVIWPWFFYAVLGLLACSTSPRPMHAAYWALCYLSAFVVLVYFIQASSARERLDRCRHLNYFGWAIAGLLFVAILYVARDALFVGGPAGMSGYGVVNRVGPTAGVTMVRAGGVARFAAVPAIFAFVLAWRTMGMARIFWGALAIGGASIVYLMQSRGAILGLVGALAFAMLFLGRLSRVLGVIVLLLVLLATFAGSELGLETDEVVSHLARAGRQDKGDITTGRTRDWSIAWAQISKSPLWGWGPQADRYFFHFHIHNTYLYAWLTSGLIGLICFVWGIVWAWVVLLRALLTGAAERAGQHTTLIQMGCLLAFFTLRGIPEVSGPMYGIDQLLMLPAMAWLGVLDQVRVEERLSEEEAEEEGGAEEEATVGAQVAIAVSSS